MATGGMNKRIIGLVAAVGLAGIAAVSLTAYVRGIESRTLAGTTPGAAYVAKDTIPVGTTGQVAISRGLIAREMIPSKFLLEQRIGSLKEIENKVALVTVFKGQQIIKPSFASSLSAKGVLPIPPDRQAMSIEVDTPRGVAGFVRARDHISIIADIAPTSDKPRSKYLIQDVEVLAVGQRVVTEETSRGATATQQTTQKVLLTLALTPQDAEKVAFALFHGEVYFTILPPEQKPVDTPGRTTDNIFS